jgi:hypothetical protein
MLPGEEQGGVTPPNRLEELGELLKDTRMHRTDDFRNSWPEQSAPKPVGPRRESEKS